MTDYTALSDEALVARINAARAEQERRRYARICAMKSESAPYAAAAWHHLNEHGYRYLIEESFAATAPYYCVRSMPSGVTLFSGPGHRPVDIDLEIAIAALGNLRLWHEQRITS